MVIRNKFKNIFFSFPSIIVLSLLIRVIWTIFVPIDLISDSDMYNIFAKRIAAGNGYTFSQSGATAYWPVGTSAFYALIFYFFGSSNTVIIITNILLGTATVYICYKYTMKVWRNEKLALLSAAAIGLWPLLIQFTTVIASEPLFIFLMLLSLYVWEILKDRPFLQAVVWGILIALLTYIRTVALPILILLPTLTLLEKKQYKKYIASILISVSAASLVFAPWVYRNYLAYGSFVLVSTNSGPNLWMGNNPETDGSYMPLPDIEFENELERDKHYNKLAKEFIMSNPGKYIALIAKRFWITYRSETIGVAWNEPALSRLLNGKLIFPLKLYSSLYWIFFFIFGFTGALLWILQNWRHVFTQDFLLLGYFFIIPLLTVGQDRYHMPIIPFLAIFTCKTLIITHEFLRKHVKDLLFRTPTS